MGQNHIIIDSILSHS